MEHSSYDLPEYNPSDGNAFADGGDNEFDELFRLLSGPLPPSPPPADIDSLPLMVDNTRYTHADDQDDIGNSYAENSWTGGSSNIDTFVGHNNHNLFIPIQSNRMAEANPLTGQHPKQILSHKHNPC